MNNTKIAKVARYVTSDGKEWDSEQRATLHQNYLDICADFKGRGISFGRQEPGMPAGSAAGIYYAALIQVLDYYDVTLKPEYQPKDKS